LADAKFESKKAPPHLHIYLKEGALFFAIGLSKNRFAYWAEYEESTDYVRCDMCNDFANFGQTSQNRFDAKEQNPGRDIPQKREQYSKN
jgi:hypothetical protein